MRPTGRLRAALAAAVVFAPVLAGGCGGGGESTPNPALKAPDVPPGRGAQQGGAAKDPKAKK